MNNSFLSSDFFIFTLPPQFKFFILIPYHYKLFQMLKKLPIQQIVFFCYFWQLLAYSTSKQTPFQVFEQTLPFPSVGYYFSVGDTLKISIQKINLQQVWFPRLVVAKMQQRQSFESMQVIREESNVQLSEFRIQSQGYYICIVIPQIIKKSFLRPSLINFSIVLLLNSTVVDLTYQRMMVVPFQQNLVKLNYLSVRSNHQAANCKLKLNSSDGSPQLYLISQSNVYVSETKRTNISGNGYIFSEIKNGQSFDISTQSFAIGAVIEDFPLGLRSMKRMLINVTTFSSQICSHRCSSYPFPVIGQEKTDSWGCMCQLQTQRWDPDRYQCIPIDFCGNSKKSFWEECDNGNQTGCLNCTVQRGYQCKTDMNEESVCSSICGDSIKNQEQQCDNGRKQGCKDCILQQGYCCQQSNMGSTKETPSVCQTMTQSLLEDSRYKCRVKQIQKNPTLVIILISVFSVLFGLIFVAIFFKWVKKNCVTPKAKDTPSKNQPATERSFIADDQVCSICLIGNCTTRLLCNHYFHKQCIQLWLSKKRQCPLCRKVLPKSLK